MSEKKSNFSNKFARQIFVLFENKIKFYNRFDEQHLKNNNSRKVIKKKSNKNKENNASITISKI